MGSQEGGDSGRRSWLHPSGLGILVIHRCGAGRCPSQAGQFLAVQAGQGAAAGCCPSPPPCSPQGLGGACLSHAGGGFCYLLVTLSWCFTLGTGQHIPSACSCPCHAAAMDKRQPSSSWGFPTAAPGRTPAVAPPAPPCPPPCQGWTLPSETEGRRAGACWDATRGGKHRH